MFSFCESVFASGRGRWHIRELTNAGQKLGGGIDTGSLCGHVKARWGWDIDVEIFPFLLAECCPICREAYMQMAKSNVPRPLGEAQHGE